MLRPGRLPACAPIAGALRVGGVMATPHFWDTSSDGMGPCTKPMDMATLGEHKAQCSTASGRWLALRYGVGQAVSFVVDRPVTAGVALVGSLVVWLVLP